MNIIKKLMLVGLIGSFLSLSLVAQEAPNATVDPGTGKLILGDGTEIDPPTGTVDPGTGTLTLGDGTQITAPTATVNQDGSLTLEDGTTLTVPNSPAGGAFLVDWFGDDLYDFDAGAGPEIDQWYWSFRFKALLHLAAGNWFWSTEFSAWMYVDPAGSSIDTGFWAFFLDLFDGEGVGATAPAPQSGGVWAYIWTSPQWDYFSDLRDRDYNGANEIGDGDAGNYPMDGWLWLLDANGYDDNGAGLFWFSEYETKYGNMGGGTNEGNFMTRFTEGDSAPSAPYWMKLTGPIE